MRLIEMYKKNYGFACYAKIALKSAKKRNMSEMRYGLDCVHAIVMYASWENNDFEQLEFYHTFEEFCLKKYKGAKL